MKKLFLFILLSLTFLCPINNTKAITTQTAAAIIAGLPFYVMALLSPETFSYNKKEKKLFAFLMLCGGLFTSGAVLKLK